MPVPIPMEPYIETNFDNASMSPHPKNDAIGEELQAQFPHARNLFLHSIKHPGTRHARAGQMRKWKMRYEELKQDDES